MNEITGNIFDLIQPFNRLTITNIVLCIPTNGMLKSNGELVMGKGLAKQFAEAYPKLPLALGSHIKHNGNTAFIGVAHINNNVHWVASIPTKNDWRDKSDLDLIVKSIKDFKEELEKLDSSSESTGWTKDLKIYLPRLGCGLGGLDWETQVKPAIEPLLDDRFYIITPK